MYFQIRIVWFFWFIIAYKHKLNSSLRPIFPLAAATNAWCEVSTAVFLKSKTTAETVNYKYSIVWTGYPSFPMIKENYRNIKEITSLADLKRIRNLLLEITPQVDGRSIISDWNRVHRQIHCKTKEVFTTLEIYEN